MIDVKKKIKQINLFNYSNKKKVIFISNTAKNYNKKYYLTPIRETKKYIYFGAVISNEKVAKKICKFIDNKIDFILVDTEKKSKNRSKNKSINIERVVRENIHSSLIFYYKANDLTVDAAENFLKSYFREDIRNIGGKNILVVGLGNIGFKLSLKLVESGANVFAYSRNKKKLNDKINIINLVKPSGSKSKCQFYNIKGNKFLKFDIIIGCGNSNSIIKKFENKNIKKDVLIIDIGKGLFSKSALKQLNKNKIIVYRLDVTSSYNMLLENLLSLHYETVKKNYKIKKIKNFIFVSQGILGNTGDIVVDNPDNPKKIYGVCDGYGDFKIINIKTKKNLEKKLSNIFRNKLLFI